MNHIQWQGQAGKRRDKGRPQGVGLGQQQELKFSRWQKQFRGRLRSKGGREPGEESFDEVKKLSEDEILKAARKLASELAAIENQSLDSCRWLYREIMSRGGLRRYRSEFEPQEEFTSNVPVHYRRKDGLPPDEMAAELGFSSDTELYAEITKTELLKRKLLVGLPKGVKAYRAKDFLEEAIEIIKEDSGWYDDCENFSCSYEDVPF